MIYPEIIQKMINFYKKYPGIGERTAERLAFATLDLNTDDIEDFSDVLLMSKDALSFCSICGHLTDGEVCSICKNVYRKKNLICVIEDYKSVFSFEKSGSYNGVYHVLGGLISPINGIAPANLNIESLVNRVKSIDNVEIIFALKSSLEGETTILYIKKILENYDVTTSMISYGIPIGADLDYLDLATLERALEDRKRI